MRQVTNNAAEKQMLHDVHDSGISRSETQSVKQEHRHSNMQGDMRSQQCHIALSPYNLCSDVSHNTPFLPSSNFGQSVSLGSREAFASALTLHVKLQSVKIEK